MLRRLGERLSGTAKQLGVRSTGMLGRICIARKRPGPVDLRSSARKIGPATSNYSTMSIGSARGKRAQFHTCPVSLAYGTSRVESQAAQQSASVRTDPLSGDSLSLLVSDGKKLYEWISGGGSSPMPGGVQVPVRPAVAFEAEASDGGWHQLALPYEGTLEQEDPGNKWVLGHESDLLQLRMTGSVDTPSGFVGLLLLGTEAGHWSGMRGDSESEKGAQGHDALSLGEGLVRGGASEAVEAGGWPAHAKQHPIGSPWHPLGVQVAPAPEEPASIALAWCTGRVLHAPQVQVYVGNAKQNQDRPGMEIVAYG